MAHSASQPWIGHQGLHRNLRSFRFVIAALLLYMRNKPGGLWLAEPKRGGTTKCRKGRRYQPNRK